MAIAQVLVKQYGVCVYQDGTRALASVNATYIEPVKEYVAKNYNLSVIDSALEKGHITEEEYRETIAYTAKS